MTTPSRRRRAISSGSSAAPRTGRRGPVPESPARRVRRSSRRVLIADTVVSLSRYARPRRRHRRDRRARIRPRRPRTGRCSPTRRCSAGPPRRVARLVDPADVVSVATPSAALRRWRSRPSARALGALREAACYDGRRRGGARDRGARRAGRRQLLLSRPAGVRALPRAARRRASGRLDRALAASARTAGMEGRPGAGRRAVRLRRARARLRALAARRGPVTRRRGAEGGRLPRRACARGRPSHAAPVSLVARSACTGSRRAVCARERQRPTRSARSRSDRGRAVAVHGYRRLRRRTGGSRRWRWCSRCSETERARLHGRQASPAPAGRGRTLGCSP